MEDVTIEKRSDIFWYYNPSILWDKERLIEFFPNPDLSLAEKLNALVRLSFYIAIILMIFLYIMRVCLGIEIQIMMGLLIGVILFIINI